MRRADMEDTVHPCDRVGKGGRFGEIPDGHLRGAVISGNICPLLITDQGAHGNTALGQLTQYPVGVASGCPNHQNPHR
jgi:hypothetical protein